MSYLRENNKKNSATRMIFVVGSYWAMSMVTFLAFIGKVTVAELIAFYTAIQGVLVGLKLGQKPMEKKEDK